MGGETKNNDAINSSRNMEDEKVETEKVSKIKGKKIKKGKKGGKTVKKGKGKKGKKKGGKKKGKKAPPRKLSKEDKALLKRISRAVAYCAQNDLITMDDLERDCKNASSATLAETKTVFRKMKSAEKLLATSEGRHAEDWAAGPTAFKDKTSTFLFEGMKKSNDTADLKAFIETCRNSIKIKAKSKGPTEKQIAEEKRLRQYRDLDWTDRKEMYTTWPIFVQERIRLERAKKLTQEVNIEYFNMNLPLTRDYLILDSELKIGTRQRLALIGPPGSGKSVLFHAMANAEIKEFPIHLHVHHMEELEVSADAGTLLSTVVEMDEYLMALRLNKAELEARIEGKNGHEAPSDEAKAAMKSNLAIVETKLRQRGHQDAEERAAKTLRVLGFDDTAQQKSINSLSGGLRMRVALCGAFFVKADILLLDEPTNHLDFPSLLWLEAQMRSYPKSLVVVCHDREILNNIATGVIQITDEKQLKYWKMGFEQYEKERWKAEKKMAKSVDKFLARNLRVDPSSESYLEVKRKREWMDKYNKMMVLRAGQFTFPPPTEIAPDNHQLGMDLPLDEVSVIKVDNVTFSYDAETLPFIFKSPISIDIKMSTRMGVQGPNGAGKSTFLKLLTGRLQPVTGTITTNKNATVGYFSQHHSAEMDLNTTPMDFMTKEFPDEAKARCRQHLGKVGVLGDLADSRMISLSQGMRSCVLFAKITMRCPSLLIMDEPTNFLDLETVDALIGAANKFQGALLLVSHSRLFLKKCATHYLSIVPGQFNIYDSLKKCERATYTFIASLEDGDKVRIGEGALATSAGSNSVENVDAKRAATEQKSA